MTTATLPAPYKHLTFIIVIMLSSFHSLDSEAQSTSSATYTVTVVPPENGAYTVTPKIPENGQVAAGTVLTVKAKPASGYALDAIYYTVIGGMWGTTSHEKFSSPMTITVDKDMWLGATFIEKELVDNVKVIQDVVYAQPGVKTLKYDVFSPKGARNLPGIVIVHGGGWSSNNEDIMRGLARELIKDRRYVVFSIDYRWINLLDGDTQPNYMHHLIEDVFGAITHIQENAHRYGLDPTRLAITGDSAGGHLAGAGALLSSLIGEGGFGSKSGIYQYLPTYMPAGKAVEQVKQEINQAVRAAAPSYGVYHAEFFSKYLQQTDPDYHHAVSPANYIPKITERTIPHFIVRGTKDGLITDGMVQPYVDLLKEAGQRVEYIQVDQARHAFFDWKPDAQTRATFAKYGVKYAGQMRQFFDSVFYNQ